MPSASSTDSRKRLRALDSCGLFSEQMEQTLSIPSIIPRVAPDQQLDESSRHDVDVSRASSHKKRSRSRSSESASRSKSRSPPRKRAQVEPDGPSANVCMVKKSGVGKIRSWMKHGIESKKEGVTLRSSELYVNGFAILVIGTSEKPKLKDFWEKNLWTLQREIKEVF
jgi:hypothetical protein